MLFNSYDITLSNYEEYFILYMDNELHLAGRQMVEAFVSQHPHLAEELDALMSTKLAVEEIAFFNKEELLSSSMKLNAVDEELLLYIDGEVTASRKIMIEEKVSTNKEYALQYSLLMQTKADASEIISYPNKEELYRYTERVVYFPVWMRVAVAVIVLLFASFFFIINSGKQTVDASSVVTRPSVNQPVKGSSLPKQKTISTPQQNEEQVLVKTPEVKKKVTTTLKGIPLRDKIVKDISNDIVLQNDNDVTPIKREVIKLDVAHIATEITSNDVALNKTIAPTPVTSAITASYNNQNEPTGTAVTYGDFEMEKKSKGKGFFRKISRFIQRNTGIGTVNADNELLIGAVALKLK